MLGIALAALVPDACQQRLPRVQAQAHAAQLVQQQHKLMTCTSCKAQHVRYAWPQ
jgi:hypothetical protein